LVIEKLHALLTDIMITTSQAPVLLRLVLSPWLPLGEVAGSAKVVLLQLQVSSAEVLQHAVAQQKTGRQAITY
jgi:hypothetical protein